MGLIIFYVKLRISSDVPANTTLFAIHSSDVPANTTLSAIHSSDVPANTTLFITHYSSVITSGLQFHFVRLGYNFLPSPSCTQYTSSSSHSNLCSKFHNLITNVHPP
jgi:hypothetical protein